MHTASMLQLCSDRPVAGRGKALSNTHKISGASSPGIHIRNGVLNPGCDIALRL